MITSILNLKEIMVQQDQNIVVLYITLLTMKKLNVEVDSGASQNVYIKCYSFMKISNNITTKTKGYKMKMITVVPAYGRDYTSKAKVLVDWNADKDFIIQDISNPYDGKPANKSDLNGFSVHIRYKSLMQIMVVNND